jgi:hypothetical protein
MDGVILNEKVAKFICESCDFKCSKKQGYDRHITTKKHIKLIGLKPLESFVTTNLYTCICGSSYKHMSSLCKHKKICANLSNNNVISISSNDSQQSGAPFNNAIVQIDYNILTELLKQNQEFKQQILEIVKEGKYITNNTTNNNQKFNMNIFLNEQCKEALDIMDFVNSLPLNIEDLENTGRIGYVKGISDIFLRNLRKLDVYKRPIHCSDLKREVMYVKDNNVWQKDEDNKKVKKAIQHIAGRNFRQVKEWIDINPDSRDVKTKKHEQYVNILTRCTGGSDKEEDDVLFNKIITNVAKEVHIER